MASERAGLIYKTRLKPEDIDLAMEVVRRVLRFGHRFTTRNIEDDFKKARQRTKDTTMVATGETRAALFRRTRPVLRGSKFVMGYKSTSNNQSYAQEFELGPVHKNMSRHFTPGLKQPKCSRRPEDAFKAFGGFYAVNPKARRKALAKSIEEIFSTNVRSATQKGNDLFYKPDFHRFTEKKATQLAALFRLAGIS